MKRSDARRVFRDRGGEPRGGRPRAPVVAGFTALALLIGLVSAGSALGATAPRYDVPRGFVRCPHAVAWNGFFKWASGRRTGCRAVARFMGEYAARASGPSMPRQAAGYRCRIRYWRDGDGDIYASRHVCTRGNVTIRFYGMV